MTDMRLNDFHLTPTTLGSRPAFRLDLGPDDSLLLTPADLEQLRHEIDRTVPHAHNTEATDPDAHVVFTSVCCGALLYRCGGGDWSIADDEGLPTKPLIHQGEAACRNCGADLAPFTQGDPPQ